MNLKNKITLISVATLMTIPTIGLVYNTNSIQVVQAAKQKDTLTVSKFTSLYNSRGRDIFKYKGKDFTTFNKDTTLKYYGNPVKIKDNYYYYVGNGAYVAADDLFKINNKEALSLSHNAYIYNKKGKNTKKLLREGLSYPFSGKYIKDDNATNYYFYRKGHNYKLSITKIKGNNYFRINENQYIKVANISNIGSNPLIFNRSTITVKKNKTPLLIVNADNDAIDSGKTLKKGQKLITDAIVHFSDGGNGWKNAYRVKGTDNYIWEDDVTIRNNVTDLGEYSDLNTYLVRPPKDGLQFYNAQGENITPNNYFYQQHQLIGVDSKMYLWIPSENKAELFYHIVATEKGFYKEIKPGVYNPKVFKFGNAFIKAADVEYYSGAKRPKLINTMLEAKENAKIKATDTQILQLRNSIQKALSTKNTTRYKLSSYPTRQNYDETIKEYQSLLNSKRNLSSAEVNLAISILKIRTENLYGKKIEVNNTNKLTKVEIELLESLIRRVYSHIDDTSHNYTHLIYDKVANKIYLITTNTLDEKITSQIEVPLTNFITER